MLDSSLPDSSGRDGIDTKSLFLESVGTASVGILLAEFAHEIGNPLFAVQGMSEILFVHRDKHLATDRAKEQVRTIHDSAVRTAGYVKQLNTLSRGDQVRVPVPLEGICNLASEIASAALGRTTDIQRAYAGSTLVQVMPARLLQFVLNTLAVLHVLSQQDSHLELTVTSDETQARLGVRSLKPVDISRFGPVTIRTLPDGDYEERWVKLAVAAAYRIAKECGGSLRVAVAPAHGVTVSLELALGSNR